MNFYKHFLGDYARDTAHLSMMEHGAYRLMLDHYYATGKSLPADKGLLYRICKAQSKAERSAVDLVAEQFFAVNGDGSRHNKRADKEIADTNAYATAQAERANKRWNKPTDMPVHMPTHVQAQSPIDASHSHSHRKEQEPAADAAQTVWDFGVTILGEQGIKEKSARSFLASVLKDWDAALVESALRSAVGKAEIKAYVLGCLREKPKKGEEKRVLI